MTALQVSFRLDRLLREFAFLRTHECYRWQRLPVAAAERLLAIGAAEYVDGTCVKLLLPVGPVAEGFDPIEMGV